MSSNQIRSLVVILIITATVMAGHLLPGLDNSRVEEGVRNGFHVLVFASVAVIFFEVLIASGLSPGRAVIATIVAVAAIGGLSETLQFLSGRQPDILDVIRDLSGAALALSGRPSTKAAEGCGGGVACCASMNRRCEAYRLLNRLRPWRRRRRRRWAKIRRRL